MHLGRQYKLSEYVIWMRRETMYLLLWAVLVTGALQILRLDFLTVPTAVLAVVGTALAIILGFKNQQCYARINEALSVWGQINSASLILANKLAAAVTASERPVDETQVKAIFHRHYAWLTAMRFHLRAQKVWENIHEPGNKKFLELLPTPEAGSSLKEELAAYLSDADLKRLNEHRGDKESFLLTMQYRAIADLYKNSVVDSQVFTALTEAVDTLFRLQGTSKRIKNYPYARNYYSIALILVKAFALILPLALYPVARDLGKVSGLEHWTAWLNVPFSVFVGWIFVTLEKVGENSSNPFEGGPNDVPISALARRMEIEMRLMLGEDTVLKPIEPKFNILF
jgi:putative membrane protein